MIVQSAQLSWQLALTHDKQQCQLIFQIVENHGQNMAVPLEKNIADDE